MQIALYQPDIPQNFGSILRLCACLDVICHVIEPCGFVIDDKRLKRVAMDYIEHAQYVRHNSWEQFVIFARKENARICLLTTKAAESYYNFAFQQSDILLLGRESAGVPDAITEAADARLRIPMAPNTRSLNIAIAAGMALGEAIRQTKK